MVLCGTVLLSDVYAEDLAIQVPFWRAKEKVFRRITEDRDIIVSVTTEDLGAGKSVLHMKGGGLTRRELTSVFKEVQRYDQLLRITSHIREVRWNEPRKEMFLHCEAFNYHARMTMKILVEEKPTPRLRFEVVEGDFLGMKGAFSFEEYKTTQTVMGYAADYEYKKLPFPRFFVEFGLEVVLQKVASLMRSFLEKQSSL